MHAGGAAVSLDLELQLKSLQLRKQMLRIIKRAGAGHTGGGLSCIDILNVLYNRVMSLSPATFPRKDRDRYVQSKGHCVEALYVVLADRGFFAVEELDTLCRYQSNFVGHPTRKVPGIEHNTGALGHGLAICVGLALAARLDHSTYRVYTLIGDGELAEGSNWEAAMAAAHYGLDNLTAIVDNNKLQISGRTRDVCNSEPIGEKFAAFGWCVKTVDGHDLQALITALSSRLEPGKPTVIIANTIKGKGISFMEDVAKWHHGVPSDEEYDRAVEELDRAASELQGKRQ